MAPVVSKKVAKTPKSVAKEVEKSILHTLERFGCSVVNVQSNNLRQCNRQTVECAATISPINKVEINKEKMNVTNIDCVDASLFCQVHDADVKETPPEINVENAYGQSEVDTDDEKPFIDASHYCQVVHSDAKETPIRKVTPALRRDIHSNKPNMFVDPFSESLQINVKKQTEISTLDTEPYIDYNRFCEVRVDVNAGQPQSAACKEEAYINKLTGHARIVPRNKTYICRTGPRTKVSPVLNYTKTKIGKKQTGIYSNEPEGGVTPVATANKEQLQIDPSHTDAYIDLSNFCEVQVTVNNGQLLDAGAPNKQKRTSTRTRRSCKKLRVSATHSSPVSLLSTKGGQNETATLRNGTNAKKSNIVAQPVSKTQTRFVEPFIDLSRFSEVTVNVKKKQPQTDRRNEGSNFVSDYSSPILHAHTKKGESLMDTYDDDPYIDVSNFCQVVHTDVKELTPHIRVTADMELAELRSLLTTTNPGEDHYH